MPTFYLGDYDDSYHSWKTPAPYKHKLFNYDEELSASPSQVLYGHSLPPGYYISNHELGAYTEQPQRGYLFYPNLTEQDLGPSSSELQLEGPTCPMDSGASCSSDRLFTTYVPNPEYEFFEPMYFDMVSMRLYGRMVHYEGILTSCRVVVRKEQDRM